NTLSPTLTWEESTDPDPDDVVTYNLVWSIDDPDFNDPDSVEGLAETEYTFEPEVLLASVRDHTPVGDKSDRRTRGEKRAIALPGLSELDEELPDDVTVYWYVRAVDTNTDGTVSLENPFDGDAWSFDVYFVEPPEGFELTAPADGTVLEVAGITFEWTDSSDPDPEDTFTYSIYVSTDPDDLGDPDETGLESTTWSMTGEDDTEYFWDVKAVDNHGEEVWSTNGPWSVSIAIPDPPTAPALVAPEDEAVIAELPTTFEWEASTDPDGTTPGYQLEIADNEAFTDPVTYDAGTDLSYEVEDLEDDTAYWWRVLATDDNTAGTYSDERGFTTSIPEAPGEFSLTAPEDAAQFTTDDLPILFEWAESVDPDGDEVSYTVEFALNPDFTDAVEVDAGTQTSAEVGDEVFDEIATWYWRVKAVDDSEQMLSTYSTEEWSINLVDALLSRPNGRPTEWSIHSAYPNPFNPSLEVVVAVPEAADLRVVVFDVLGREAASLFEGRAETGYQTFHWRAEGPAGVYFLRVSNGKGWSAVQKLVYVK
ncbi:T9SS type A sorting domain-containing protein, partial [bacterium]|nr:T9SS type A sorting domain-containing protein [bacterium]